jgi:uncharacterized protein (UPF0332 family)
MKDLDFLNKLKRKGKVELVDSSEEISDSYRIKSENCLKSSKILFGEGIYENSIIEAYYAMYNIVVSLFFKCGVKCENHTGAIIVLEEVFELEKLGKILEKGKRERIDKQYYVEGEKNIELSRDGSEEMIKIAEEFILEIKSIIGNLSNDKIKRIRERYQKII